MKTNEYYFAVFGLGVDEEGMPCEAYMKMALDCEVPEAYAVAMVENYFPDFKGKIRLMSREEYIECAGDDEDENA